MDSLVVSFAGAFDLPKKPFARLRSIDNQFGLALFAFLTDTQRN
jgi:hypothetical protein